MTRLEERLMDTFAKKLHVGMRLINDIFFVRTHWEDRLRLFIYHLNSSHDTIKFTNEHSIESISFLDVTAKVERGESLRQTCFVSQLIPISILNLPMNILQNLLVSLMSRQKWRGESPYDRLVL